MASENPVRAAAYTRLSTVDIGNLATERQAEDAQGYIARKPGWELVKLYSDQDSSGWTGARREEFESMFRDLEAGAWDVLVVYRLDRLARNLKDYARFYETSRKLGVRLIGVADGVDTSTAAGRFAATVLLGVAQQESENTSARLQRKHRQLAEQGRPSGGSRRYGYDSAAMSNQVPEEAAIVREVYARFLAGETLWGIHKALRARGVTTTNGKPFSYKAARSFIENPAYAGLRAYKGSVVGAATWDPIVTREEWDAAQTMLSMDTRRRTPRARNEEYLLSGIIECAGCGLNLTGARRHGGAKVYRCHSRERDSCYQSIAMQRTDDYVASIVLAELDRPLEEASPERAQERDRHLTELAALDARREELAALFGEGDLSALEWKAARKGLERREVELRAALADAGPGRELSGLPRGAEALVAFWEDASFTRRRAIVGAVIESAKLKSLGKGYRGPVSDRLELQLR